MKPWINSGSIVVVILSAAGCGFTFSPASLEGLPPELAYVVEHRNDFAFDPNDSLAKVSPGTVQDDLADIDGCWGTALESPLAVEGSPIVSIYFVLRFAADSGEVIDWVLTDLPFEGVAVAGRGAGAYQTTENRISTIRTEYVNIDPATGEAEVLEDFPRHTLDYLATRNGDRLRLHFGEADRQPVDPGDDVVYVRFECPDG